MSIIGKIEKLYRFPVKSMAGEELDQAFVGFSGVYGDRLYAFKKHGGAAFFPYLTARDTQQMLLYKPRFRHPDVARLPIDWAQAAATSIGITPVYGSAEELIVDVETPRGDIYGVTDAALIDTLSTGLPDATLLSVCHSDRALTDGRPVSMISRQTIDQLSRETGMSVDGRRFRANIYVDMLQQDGFSEDQLVGRTLRLGDRVMVTLVDRDPRCAMITYDPDTGVANPELLRHVTKAHGRQAGVYAAVITEGVVKPGDSIELVAWSSRAIDHRLC